MKSREPKQLKKIYIQKHLKQSRCASDSVWNCFWHIMTDVTFADLVHTFHWQEDVVASSVCADLAWVGSSPRSIVEAVMRTCLHFLSFRISWLSCDFLLWDVKKRIWILTNENRNWRGKKPYLIWNEKLMSVIFRYLLESSIPSPPLSPRGSKPDVQALSEREKEYEESGSEDIPQTGLFTKQIFALRRKIVLISLSF